MRLFEVLDGRVSELSILACGCAPCGGDLVVAETVSGARQLWALYREGKRTKKTYFGKVENQMCHYPIRNCIS